MLKKINELLIKKEAMNLKQASPQVGKYYKCKFLQGTRNQMHEISPKLRAVRGKLGNGDAVERFGPATGTRTHSNRGARKLEGRARAGVQLPCGCSGDRDA